MFDLIAPSKPSYSVIQSITPDHANVSSANIIIQMIAKI